MFKADNKDRGGARGGASVTIDEGDYHNMGFHTCWGLWTRSRVQGILISHQQWVLAPVWKAKGGTKKKKQNAICLLLNVTTLWLPNLLKVAQAILCKMIRIIAHLQEPLPQKGLGDCLMGGQPTPPVTVGPYYKSPESHTWNFLLPKPRHSVPTHQRAGLETCATYILSWRRRADRWLCEVSGESYVFPQSRWHNFDCWIASKPMIVALFPSNCLEKGAARLKFVIALKMASQATLHHLNEAVPHRHEWIMWANIRGTGYTLEKSLHHFRANIWRQTTVHLHLRWI